MERHPAAQNLESMEQNIEAFSKLEKQRITRIVRSSVRRHVKVSNASRRKTCFQLRNSDALTRSSPSFYYSQQFSPEELKKHTATATSEKETICSICLEDLIPSSGSSNNNKKAVCSSNNPLCRHLYHEDCIVSWLAPKAQWLCPICRQEFIVKRNRNSSGSSTIAATDMCNSSVCALSTIGQADLVSTMSTASELGDALPLSPGAAASEELFESSELDDIAEGLGDQSRPSSSASSTVQDDTSSSSGSDGNNGDAVEQQE